MDSIPPDVAKKPLTRDFAKICHTERAMLQAMAAGAASASGDPQR